MLYVSIPPYLPELKVVNDIASTLQRHTLKQIKTYNLPI